MDFSHIPVLLNETIELLSVKPSGVYLDGTAGGGGHSYEIAKRLTEGGKLFSTDRDGEAVRAAEERLAPFKDRVQVIRGNYADYRELIAPYLEDEKGSCEVLRTGKPLFFPPDSPMVKALHQAYMDVTGDTESKPQVIGGGTYAKELPGIIAFGCEWPGEDNRIHNADEFLKIEQFKQQVEIYVKAIENLLAL